MTLTDTQHHALAEAAHLAGIDDDLWARFMVALQMPEALDFLDDLEPHEPAPDEDDYEAEAAHQGWLRRESRPHPYR